MQIPWAWTVAKVQTDWLDLKRGLLGLDPVERAERKRRKQEEVDAFTARLAGVEVTAATPMREIVRLVRLDVRARREALDAAADAHATTTGAR